MNETIYSTLKEEELPLISKINQLKTLIRGSYLVGICCCLIIKEEINIRISDKIYKLQIRKAR